MLDAEPLELIGGKLDHKPQLPVLLALTEEIAAEIHPAALRRWLRSTGRLGRPVDLLVARDYATFEDALEDLRGRGFVVRSGR